MMSNGKSCGFIASHLFAIAGTPVTAQAVATEEFSPHLSAELENRIGLCLNDRLPLVSSPEGVRSVATDWANGGPGNWVHAYPPNVCHPSTPRTSAGAVAVHAGLPGDSSLFEEHRYAAPFLKEAPAPKLWQHDILRADGTPFNARDARFIKVLTGKFPASVRPQ
jgi:hypothetical protein